MGTGSPASSGDGAWKKLLLPVAALAILLAYNALCTPGFFAVEIRDGRVFGTLIDILNHGSKKGILALGMTLVIATGGVDLSVGAVMAVCGAIAASLVVAGHGAGIAIVAALGAGVVGGLWNGALVTFLRLQPIVATLVLMVMGRGIAQLLTDGLIVTFQDPTLTAIGNSAFLGLPFPVTMLAAFFLCVYAATRRTALGLFIESVGDSAPAARLSGVPDRAVTVLTYVVCGLGAGAAGLIECSYIRAADANNAGMTLELDAILAVVIGGTSLTGGRFNLGGSIVGALLIETLTKTLIMQNVSTDIAPAPKALVVLGVCLLYSPSLRGRLSAFAARRGRASAA